MALKPINLVYMSRVGVAVIWKSRFDNSNVKTQIQTYSNLKQIALKIREISLKFAIFYDFNNKVINANVRQREICPIYGQNKLSERKSLKKVQLSSFWEFTCKRCSS